MKTDEQGDFEVWVQHLLEGVEPILLKVARVDDFLGKALIGDISSVLTTGIRSGSLGEEATVEWWVCGEVIATWFFQQSSGLILYENTPTNRDAVGDLTDGFYDLENHAQLIFRRYRKKMKERMFGAIYGGGEEALEAAIQGRGATGGGVRVPRRREMRFK